MTLLKKMLNFVVFAAINLKLFSLQTNIQKNPPSLTDHQFMHQIQYLIIFFNKSTLLKYRIICNIYSQSTQINLKNMQATPQENQASSPKQHKKQEYKKKREEKHKQEKPRTQYDRNPQLITINTQIPPIPKLPNRPDIQQWKAKDKKNKQQIKKLKDERAAIKAENFKPAKKLAKGEQGNTVFDQFHSQIEDVKQLKEKRNALKKKLQGMREAHRNLIAQAKENNQKIKDYKELMKNSKQSLKDTLSKLEKRLTTAQLTKEEERNINNQILVIRRQLSQAQDEQDIQHKLNQAIDRRQQLNQMIEKSKQQKEPLEEQLTDMTKQLETINGKIDKTKKEMSTQTTQKTQAKLQNQKEWQQWKQAKKKRISEIEAKIKKIQDLNDKLWDDYDAKKDQYWEKKRYADYIKWQTDVKRKKVNQKIYEEKAEERKLKQLAQEKEDKKRRFYKELELINFLISHCKSLYPNEEQTRNTEVEKLQDEDIKKKIAQDKEWKKQKGLEIVQSKKNKIDEEPVKNKGKKNKKNKQQKKEEPKFEVDFKIKGMFSDIKILPPQSVQDLDRVIKELQEKYQLFLRACQDKIDEKDQQMIEQIQKKQEEKVVKKAKNQEEQFPEL